MKIKKLYTAVATSIGGRGGPGTARTPDGMLDVKIDGPKELGGKYEGTNPDQLFAAGYSTCYLGAIKYVAGKEKKPVAISATPASRPMCRSVRAMTRRVLAWK